MKLANTITKISNLHIKEQYRLLLITLMSVVIIYSLIVKSEKMPDIKTEVISEDKIIAHNNAALTKDFIYEREINKYVHDMPKFKNIVITYSNNLGVPYEWFICAIKSESNFNPLASNAKGSGAIGFIQFMPFNYSSNEFDNLTKNQFMNLGWEQQLHYTHRYLKNRIDTKKDKGVILRNFTDYYMIIFYPEAVGKPDTFEIARFNTKNKNTKRVYCQNSGCDCHTAGKDVRYDANGKIIANPDKVLTKRDMEVWLYGRFKIAYNLNI